MGRDNEKILSFDSLSIGFISGRTRHLLLPPMTASANRGELVAVIGVNGIGKSTLLRTLARLQPSLGGVIKIDGRNISGYSRLQFAQRAGFISTEVVRTTNMTVYDLVAIGRFPHTNWLGKMGELHHEAISGAIEKAGLLKFQNRYINELSDGERQRAMIARVLAQDTNILIMDEPTAFLDVSSKYEIIHLLRQLSREKGKTVIFSTHDLQAALSQADKIWLMLEESLVEGSPEDLMLENTFDRLFAKTIVKFDSRNGSFLMAGENRGSVVLEGKGKEKYWTARALVRAGFSVSEETREIIVKVHSGNRWSASAGDEHFESSSIYELIRWLTSVKT